VTLPYDRKCSDLLAERGLPGVPLEAVNARVLADHVLGACGRLVVPHAPAHGSSPTQARFEVGP
jgi:hypothetical protein